MLITILTVLFAASLLSIVIGIKLAKECGKLAQLSMLENMSNNVKEQFSETTLKRYGIK